MDFFSGEKIPRIRISFFDIEKRFSGIRIKFPDVLLERQKCMDMNEQAQYRRKALAKFLRARREHILPEQQNLPARGRRRTPGLRREEVALLAGVNVDSYTRLEQARLTSVSEEFLESVARALCLNAHEREHLFLLAHQHLPPEAAQLEETVSSALQCYLELEETTPAYVLGKRWNILAINRAASILFDYHGPKQGYERHLIWYAFTSPYIRQLLLDNWEEAMRRELAQFQANTRHFLHDPWLTRFVADLSAVSPEFCAWWSQYDVLTKPLSDNKVMFHPVLGQLEFYYITFQLHETPDLTIVTYLSKTPATKQKMKKLIVK
jgi:hypothetical protein